MHRRLVGSSYREAHGEEGRGGGFRGCGDVEVESFQSLLGIRGVPPEAVLFKQHCSMLSIQSDHGWRALCVR